MDNLIELPINAIEIAELIYFGNKFNKSYFNPLKQQSNQFQFS